MSGLHPPSHASSFVLLLLLNKAEGFCNCVFFSLVSEINSLMPGKAILLQGPNKQYMMMDDKWNGI